MLGRPDMVLALPVRGESFLLRRARRAVLVDGGLPSDRVATVLERHVGDVRRLDVVLCTHGDRDHAGGLPKLLNDWAGRIGQLWLPGRWVDVIPSLARDPAGFASELVRELDSELKAPSDQVLDAIRDPEEQAPQRRRRDIPSLPQNRNAGFGDGLFDGADEALASEEVPLEPEWFSTLRQFGEELASDGDALRAFDAARRKVRRRHKRLTSKLEVRIALYWLDLIDTAKAIRGIAVAAIRHRIRTRWFDFEEFARTRRPVGGARGFLVPVNAVEQEAPPTRLVLYMRADAHQSAEPRLSRASYALSARRPLLRRLTARGRSGIYPLIPANPPAAKRADRGDRAAPWLGVEQRRVRPSERLGQIPRAFARWRHREAAGTTYLDQQSCLRLCAKCPRAGHAPVLSGVVAPGPRWWTVHTLGRRCDCHTSV